MAGGPGLASETWDRRVGGPRQLHKRGCPILALLGWEPTNPSALGGYYFQATRRPLALGTHHDLHLPPQPHQAIHHFDLTDAAELTAQHLREL